MVFVARDRRLDREIAIKFLLPEHTKNAEVLSRFLQEARATAKIGHPGIVTVFDCDQVSDTGTELDGGAYIAMELLAGETLGSRLRRRRMNEREAVAITSQIALALEAAHAIGIVHRDLKPENVFLAHDPAVSSGERVKVLDFGIAKLATSSTDQAPRTHSLAIFGTPPYMSPEQARSSGRSDHRTDIYALGCILFEQVAGRAPFIGEPGEVMAHHQLTPAPRVRSLAEWVSSPLDALVHQLLQKRPDDRPQSMREVHELLRACYPLAGHAVPDATQSAPRTESATNTTLTTATGSATGRPAPARLGQLFLVVAVVCSLVVAAVGMYVRPSKTTTSEPSDAAVTRASGVVITPIEQIDAASSEIMSPTDAGVVEGTDIHDAGTRARTKTVSAVAKNARSGAVVAVPVMPTHDAALAPSRPDAQQRLDDRAVDPFSSETQP